MWRGNGRFRRGWVFVVGATLAVAFACGESDDGGDGGDGAGSGGDAGTAGSSGAAGSSAGATSGAAGSTAGGNAGRGGAATGGAGMSGNGTGGTDAGEAGMAGEAGEEGMGGEGTGGASGGAGGAASGRAGMGGAGMSGRAGMGGAGMGGAGMGGAGMGGAGMGGAGAGMGGAGMGGAGMAGSGGSGGTFPINLYFSEYYEGTATPQQSAVEIFNAGNGAVDLTQCFVRVYVAGMPSFQSISLLTTLQPDQVYVVCSSQFTANCDRISSIMGMVTGDDSITLVCNGSETQDIIGQPGFDPGTEWGTGITSTADNVMRRNCDVTIGDRSAIDAFNPVFDWLGAAVSVADLGSRFCTTM